MPLTSVVDGIYMALIRSAHLLCCWYFIFVEEGDEGFILIGIFEALAYLVCFYIARFGINGDEFASIHGDEMGDEGYCDIFLCDEG